MGNDTRLFSWTPRSAVVLPPMQRFSGFCKSIQQRLDHLLRVPVRQADSQTRFAFGHGQMTETELKKIMHLFLQKEIDVLVCTTIIESGLDIPNANTIIVERADMFGLAQLYQLRGRVGRSHKQAYCYFLIPKMEKLGREAQKRLKVLQGLDDLGQGFNVAIQDLEIRGAGNNPFRAYLDINIRADIWLGNRAALMGVDARTFGVSPTSIYQHWRHNILQRWP